MTAPLHETSPALIDALLELGREYGPLGVAETAAQMVSVPVLVDDDTARLVKLGKDELADWLIDNGLAEDRRGYGHATGEQIAEKLLSEFAIYREAEANDG